MNKVCKTCNEEKELNTVNFRLYDNKYYSNDCRECIRAANRIYSSRPEVKEAKRRLASTDKARSSKRKYYYKNKEYINKWVSEWKRNNKGKVNAYCAKRKANKVSATPKWANIDEIKWIYEMCPEGYQVDHIIPLQGDTVCGLHVENNLQYLTIEENLRKGNRLL